MAVIRRLKGNTAQDQGEWFTYCVVPSDDPSKPDEEIKYRLRAIPDVVAVRLESKFLGDTATIKFKEEHREMDIDSEKGDALQRAKLEYALTDCLNNDVEVKDVEAQALFIEEFPDCKIGDVVRIDGHLTVSIKKAVLFPDRKWRNWAMKKVETLSAVAGEVEAGKGKSS